MHSTTHPPSNDSTKPTSRRLSAVRVELVRERNVSYPGDGYIRNASDLAAVARAFIGNADREVFLAVFLSAKHRVTAVQETATGTLSATLVHPRETFRGAILACASAVCLVHNHPSGDPTPSPEDLALTATLLDAGSIVGVRVLDHLVLGDPGFTSLRETTGLWSGHEFHR